MQSTRILRKQYQPMIRFLGRRHSPPKASDAQSPQPHPESPTHSLPESFASYRQKAIQHGPLGPRRDAASSQQSSGGGISYGKQPSNGRSGHSLGSIQPGHGESFSRYDLPKRFQVTSWSPEEIEAIESGGASMHI